MNLVRISEYPNFRIIGKRILSQLYQMLFLDLQKFKKVKVNIFGVTMIYNFAYCENI